MSGAVVSISAEAEVLDPSVIGLSACEDTGANEDGGDAAVEEAVLPDDCEIVAEEQVLLPEEEYASESWGEDRDLWMYRDRTVALLRRYARLAVETGRLPSLLGREFFRTKVTSYHVSTFEDTVIFVHDVEQSLDQLGWFQKKVVAMIVLEEFTQEETAQILQCSPRTVGRYIYEALDMLSEIFLRGSILKPMAKRFPNRETPCQGGKSDSFPVSDCNEGRNKF